jgi:hypothetical protein
VRRGVPIHAYIGHNGGGKSLAAVYDSLLSLAAGRPVLSTVRLLDTEHPRPCPGCNDPAHAAGHQAAHPLYVPFHDFRQLLTWRDGDVFMDEVTGIASSRESAGMPVQVANYLPQLRRRNVVLRWTSPAWARADKIIREVTQGVTVCSGHLAVRRETPPGQAPRLWLDRRLFRWRTFDASAFDEYTRHAADRLRPMVSQWFWRPGSLAETAYDTFDPVLALGTASEAGLCMVCGGRRTHPKCGCDTGEAGGAVQPARGRTATQRPRSAPAAGGSDIPGAITAPPWHPPTPHGYRPVAR